MTIKKIFLLIILGLSVGVGRITAYPFEGILGFRQVVPFSKALYEGASDQELMKEFGLSHRNLQRAKEVYKQLTRDHTDFTSGERGQFLYDLANRKTDAYLSEVYNLSQNALDRAKKAYASSPLFTDIRDHLDQEKGIDIAGMPHSDTSISMVKGPSIFDMFKEAVNLAVRSPGIGAQRLIAASDTLARWANTLSPEVYSRLKPEQQQLIITAGMVLSALGVLGIKYRKTIGGHMTDFTGKVYRAPGALMRGVQTRLPIWLGGIE